MENPPVVHIKINTPWLRILVTGLVILQLAIPNKAWMIALTGFGGLWLLAYIWAKQLGSGLRLLRQQQYGWLQVGDWVEEHFTLRNNSLAPATWLSIEDSSDLPGHSVSLGTGIEAQTERRWVKRSPCARRGEYTLGPIKLITGDIFGIYSVFIEYPDTITSVVVPPVVRLPLNLEIVSGRLVDDRQRSRSRAEKSVTSISAREYVSGDSFAKIHWKITARQNEPYVRVFENLHASNAWWILLDLDQSVQVGEGESASDERAIILAGSLSDAGLRAGRLVGMLASAREKIILLPDYGFGQRRVILRSLALAACSDLHLEDLIEQSHTFVRRNSNLIIITSSSGMEWLMELERYRDRGITPMVALVASDDPAHVASLSQFGDLLGRRGFKHYLFTAETFSVPEARPGHRGEVRWKFTPHGRAIKIPVGEGETR